MGRARRTLAAAAAAGLAAAPILADVRVRRAARPEGDRWRSLPIEPRGPTRFGVSVRPLQAETFGLDPSGCLDQVLALPFPILRVGAYWDRIEPQPGAFDPGELDRQVDRAERRGRDVILCLGAVKTFGYPECFVPTHHLTEPLSEGRLVSPETHPHLLDAAVAHVTRLVERYRDRRAVVAWQVEHESVDPLGMEHSWRLAAGFVAREVAAVRAADPGRPVVATGFCPTSLLVRAHQWWRTRDQGDALLVAAQVADVVGVDMYPRHALLSLGAATVYLDGGRTPWQRHALARCLAAARTRRRRVMVTEGQAEPWESVTTPPNPPGRAMYSCAPEQVITTYNQCMREARRAGVTLDAYLFWGAEYWLLRSEAGDGRYLDAVRRILGEA